MTLFGIGPMELVIILALALVVLGPHKLPEVARAIGKTLNEFRRASQDVTAAVTRELDMGATPLPTTVKAPELPQDIMKTLTLDNVLKTVDHLTSPAAAPAAAPAVEVEPSATVQVQEVAAPPQAEEVAVPPVSSDEDAVTHG